MDIKINHDKIKNTVTVTMKVPLLSNKAPKSERRKYKTNFILDFVKEKGYDIDSVMKKDTVLNFAEKGNTGTWKFKLVGKGQAPPAKKLKSYIAALDDNDLKPSMPQKRTTRSRKSRPKPTPKED